DEHAELHDAFDPVERAKRRLHLREEHDPAAARSLLASFEVSVFTEAALDQAAVLGKADLARNVEESAFLDGGDIGRNGGRRLGQGDCKFGEALVYAHAPPQ